MSSRTVLGRTVSTFWFGCAGTYEAWDRGERRAVSAKVKQFIKGLAPQRPPLPSASVRRAERWFVDNTPVDDHKSPVDDHKSSIRPLAFHAVVCAR